jgi:hypothetical protein
MVCHKVYWRKTYKVSRFVVGEDEQLQALSGLTAIEDRHMTDLRIAA